MLVFFILNGSRRYFPSSSHSYKRVFSYSMSGSSGRLLLDGTVAAWHTGFATRQSHYQRSCFCNQPVSRRYVKLRFSPELHLSPASAVRIRVGRGFGLEFLQVVRFDFSCRKLHLQPPWMHVSSGWKMQRSKGLAELKALVLHLFQTFGAPSCAP